VRVLSTPAGREALLHYVLRPPVAQERVEQRPCGLVRITLKKAYTDGIIAVDMDPLSLLCRLATSMPPPRFHTVKYAGVRPETLEHLSRDGPALLVLTDVVDGHYTGVVEGGGGSLTRRDDDRVRAAPTRVL
jgi:hypothetical protein